MSVLPEPPVLLSLEDAASVLGISTATAYRLRREGEFPIRVLKIGSQFRVLQADLDSFLRGEPAA